MPDVEDTIAKVFAIDAGTSEAQVVEQPPAPPDQPVAPEATALTNDDVIKMSQLKLGEVGSS